MSLSFAPVKTVKTIDPRLDFTKHSFVATEGAQESSFQGYAPQSFNNSTILYSIVPASKQTVIDRKILHRVTVQLAITGLAPVGQPLLSIGTADAPRSYGLHRLANSITCGINNSTFTVASCNTFPAVAHVKTESLAGWCDGVPNTLDRYASYDSGLATNNNVLGAYGSSLLTEPRGAFPITVTANPVGAGSPVTIDRLGVVGGSGGGAYVVGSTPVTALVSWTEWSPIVASPFEYGGEDQVGLVGLDRLQFQFAFNSTYQQLWSHANASGSVITQVAPQTSGLFVNPMLWLNSLTPKLLNETVPRDIVVPYSELIAYQQSQGIVAAGATADMVSNAVQLKGIPDKLMVYVRTPLAAQGVDDPDTFWPISRISITLENATSVLQTASPFHLYQMSKKNGLSLSWPEFQGSATALGGASVRTIGSPLVLQFGQDIPLKDGVSSGITGPRNFQLTVTCTNPTGRAVAPEVVFIPCYTGTITIADGSVIPQVSVLTTNDVLNADPVPHSMLGAGMSGGSFFSSAASGWQKIAPYLSKGKQALEMADKAGLLGRGASGAGMSSGLVYGLGESGAGMSGGKKISKAKLKAQLLAQ